MIASSHAPQTTQGPVWRDFPTGKTSRRIGAPRLPRLLVQCFLLAAVSGALPNGSAAANRASQSESNLRDSQTRFLTYEEAAATSAQYRNSDFAGSAIADPSSWNIWVREQDRAVRDRIDRGTEDSICNLILLGTSFTKLPRLGDSDQAIEGTPPRLTEAARARTRTLVFALGAASPNERLAFIRDFLKRKRIASQQTENYLATNLVRYVEEQLQYHQKLKDAANSSDSGRVLATRGTLYSQRGLSVDTSLLPNYAIEDTLRVMLAKGAVTQGIIKRIAIVGPGLDFTDKRDGYDFYPLQTLQPFAVMEAVERLGLGKAEDLQVTTLDLNAAVNDHVTRLAARGRQGRPYIVQLPRDTAASWTIEAISYWEHFGEILGTPATPLPVPGQMPSVKLRAIAVAAQRASRVRPINMNIVGQTADFPAGEGFDLVIATNILVYYDNFQQALAMSNIARMMNAGGIFVSNTPLPSAHDVTLKFLGARSVIYARDQSYGDDIVVYRKQ